MNSATEQLYTTGVLVLLQKHAAQKAWIKPSITFIYLSFDF